MSSVEKEEVYEEAKEIIRSYLRLDDDEIKPDTHIVNDAGADSLALVELGFQLTEKFGVPISDTSDEKLLFQNLVDYIIENIEKKNLDRIKNMLSKLDYPKSQKLNINKYSKILSTAVHLPDNIVTNQDIIERYDLIATDRAVQHSIGIKERRFADEGESVSDLLYKVAEACLKKANISVEKLDRVIYTKLLGDKISPATSIKVLEKLGLKKGIPAFDISAACSGFVHLVDMAIRYIDSGDNYVLILGGDISTRLYSSKNKKDTRTIFLNGDAVVGMLIGPADREYFSASYLYTDNTYFDYSYIPFGTELLNNSQNFSNEIFNMQMPDGMIVHNSVVDSAEIVAQKLLEQTNTSLDQIDIFATCDQTTFTWKAQLDRLKIPSSKSVSLFEKCGNTVAAMSIINLNELIDTGKLVRGMKVMLMAHGAGASGGGLIFEY